MSITAPLIKQLRERTGAGLMACKQALVETAGDIESAIAVLRTKGAAAAEKKAGRIATEGVIVCVSDAGGSAMGEINCETDFVAKDALFKEFAEAVVAAVLAGRVDSVDQLAAAALASGESVESARQALIAKIGEKVSVRRVCRLTAGQGAVGTYLHGTRIGVMVRLRGGSDALGHDLAMHIAASNPLCISADQMPPEVLAREQQIVAAQAADSGKPAGVVDKMVAGRMKKFLGQNTLLGQPFVKHPEQTVAELLAPDGACVEQMVRYEVGEGLEKRSDDFVAEVMAQAGQ